MKKYLYDVLALSLGAKLLQRGVKRLVIEGELQLAEEVDKTLCLVVH